MPDDLLPHGSTWHSLWSRLFMEPSDRAEDGEDFDVEDVEDVIDGVDGIVTELATARGQRGVADAGGALTSEPSSSAALGSRLHVCDPCCEEERSAVFRRL